MLSTPDPRRCRANPTRAFTRVVSTHALLLVGLVAMPIDAAAQSSSGTAAPASRRIAITIDDLPVVSVTRRDLAFQQRVTRELLAALGRHRVPAIGFVNENKLEENGAVDPRRVALLQAWLARGMELGNHGYAHLDLHHTPLDEFQRDVLRGERITRPVMDSAGVTLRWFRHPMLHTGRSLATRDSLHRFLAEHGYAVAPVTMDNNEYIFAAAFDRTPDEALRQRIAATYLAYMESVVAFYESQSVAHLGRDIPHVLLLHANALNAATLDQLLHMLVRRGYAFVPIAEAIADPAYRSADTYVGPGGITWLHRWALTAGKRGAAFAGEPEVPAWVREAAAPQ